MKVIFLDVDGVLNNRQWNLNQRDFKKFDPNNIRALNYITDNSEAKIVISSNWRLYPYDFPAIFREQGITGEIIGQTPILSFEVNGIFRTVIRGDEIYEWQRARHDIENFVIIDDEADMGILIDSLVRTDMECGLTISNARDAINMLR